VNKIRALLASLIIIWVLVSSGAMTQAQEPVEFSVLLVDIEGGEYTIMAESSIYAGLGIESLQGKVIESADKFPTSVTLPDYMALYGVFGFKLEATFEMEKFIMFVFSRPITIPASVAGA